MEGIEQFGLFHDNYMLQTRTLMGKTFRRKRLSTSAVAEFRKTVYDFYERHGRSFPWRKTRNPYHIFVSEVMLQQTRTERVAGKYGEFIRRFPSIRSLAEAPLQKILKEWQGMGYNRRAIALKKSAEIIVKEFRGRIPSSVQALTLLPGVGKATASAIAAFAFNEPVAFIETNIRSVFIHFFFRARNEVKDAEIVPLVEETLDRRNPRRWYYALMDYGVLLKKTHDNPARKSAHHKRQPPFRGSNRQIRGMIIKALVTKGGLPEKEIVAIVKTGEESVRANLVQLQKEGLIRKREMKFVIA